MTDSLTYKPELLAPAGCFPSLHAAIKAGADAVYFGVAQLNMRARARRSFQFSDIKQVVDICHQGSIKAYLTLNTLLYDFDMAAAGKILREALDHDLDAVIVSDMSTVQMAVELGLEVHLSTQLSISNYESVKFYAPYCDRIVLARELSLAMIKNIHEQIKANNLRGRSGRLMEIEAFAHGAMCIAVSGRCGMSLYTSNASANRGACEQNCRKEYVVTDKETGEQLEVDNNFVMSPEDICTIDFLDEMLDSGVICLKIEGRGRAPEYVHTVTTSYRRAIDALNAGTYTPELAQSLLDDLKQVYNRGLSSGYYLGRKQGWSEAYGSKSTRKKVAVGTVTNYFERVKVVEVTGTQGQLSVGDQFTIVGNTTGVVDGTVGELRVDNDSVERVAGHTLFTMKIDQKVRRGDRLFYMQPVP